MQEEEEEEEEEAVLMERGAGEGGGEVEGDLEERSRPLSATRAPSGTASIMLVLPDRESSSSASREASGLGCV